MREFTDEVSVSEFPPVQEHDVDPDTVLEAHSGMDEHVALLLLVSPDWEHLIAHEDVPPVYNAWPAMRRRYLHACMAIDTLPEDAAWSLTGHFLLRAAIAGDTHMDMAFQAGRLDPEARSPRP